MGSLYAMTAEFQCDYCQLGALSIERNGRSAQALARTIRGEVKAQGWGLPDGGMGRTRCPACVAEPAMPTQRDTRPTTEETLP